MIRRFCLAQPATVRARALPIFLAFVALTLLAPLFPPGVGGSSSPTSAPGTNASAPLPAAPAPTAPRPSVEPSNGEGAGVPHPSTLLYSVTFKEVGLPLDAVFFVTAGSPPVTFESANVSASGAFVQFAEPNGTLPFNISGPARWGVALVTGPPGTNFTSVPVTATTTVTVKFGKLEHLFVNESGERVAVDGTPGSIAVDSGQDRLYVTDQSKDVVRVVSLPDEELIGNISVGFQPAGLAYDAALGEILVADYGSNSVAVINDTTDTVVASIPTLGGPSGDAFDPVTGDFIVADYSGNAVSVISVSARAVVATIPLGENPDAVVVDPAAQLVFVACGTSGDVVAYNETTFAPTANITVGAYPHGLGVDPTAGELYVVDEAASTVDVVSVANDTVVATIPVGYAPTGRIAYDPTLREVFVANSGSDSVSVISTLTNTVVETIGFPVLSSPRSTTYDASLGAVFVPDYGSSQISIISDSVGAVTGGILFGTVEGPVIPRWPGLTPGTVWGIVLTPVLPGGPPAVSATGSAGLTGGSVNLTIPQGARYSYHLTKPSVFRAGGSKRGVFTMPGERKTLLVKFRFITTGVTFVEHGLPHASNWSVLIIGPSPSANRLTVAGQGSTIHVALVNGTYSYVLQGPSGSFASVANGSFVVRLHHRVTIRVGFAPGIHGLLGALSEASPVSAPAGGAGPVGPIRTTVRRAL